VKKPAPTQQPTNQKDGLKAWIVFLGGGLAYCMAMCARTSFGVAVPWADQRFGLSSAQLAVFIMGQLAVYAAAQIPVGLLLDRYGSRKVLTCGLIIVGLGQLALAQAHTFPTALAARALVGAGDATAFIGVVRFLPAWFSASRVPLLTQITNVGGQIGQVISAFPVVWWLHDYGWSTSFNLVALAVFMAAVSTAVLVRDDPSGAKTPVAQTESVRRSMGAVLRNRATWVGWMIHATAAFPFNVIALMWGSAWMRQGMHLSDTVSATMLSLEGLFLVAAGIPAGIISGRWPRRRLQTCLAAYAISVLTWVVGLALSPSAAAALIVIIGAAIGSCVGALGFDIVREYTQRSRWGVAIGTVNTGGFVSSIIAVELVGLILDLRGGARTGSDFIVAFGAMGVIIAVLVVSLLIVSRRLHPQVGIPQES